MEDVDDVTFGPACSRAASRKYLRSVETRFMMRIRGWKSRDKGARFVGGMTAECEAFLHGSYVEYLASRGSVIPSWARLNLLAHGTGDQIRALAGTAPHDGATSGEMAWQSALSLLAVETLQLAEATGHSVAEIQRSTLIDVELALAREGDKRWLRPREVVGRTMAALHRHPSDRR